MHTYIDVRIKIVRGYNMRCEKELLDTIKIYLPPTSQIVLFKTPYKRSAVEFVDLDGDNVAELVCAYYWQGEYYIDVLKCYGDAWHVLDTVKGKGYNITYLDAAPINSIDKNNLVAGWQVGAIWSDLSVYEMIDGKLVDLTTYRYYLADAQIKIGNTKEVCQSVNKALAAKYPYPSAEKLMELKKEICEDKRFYNENGIDFLTIKYITSEKEKDTRLEKAIIKAFDLSQDEGKVRYYYNNIDLNDDGKPEVFVYLVGPFVCGTGGCSAAIFKQENGEYKLLSKFSLVNNPIIISDNKTNGYKDIIMDVYGGGIESFFAKLKFDGIKYPMNPSIQPKVEPGTKVEGIAIIADDITKNFGIELKNSKIPNSTNQEIIGVEVGNILGQYTHDKVILVGHYLYKDSSYVENVEIVIEPEKSGTPIMSKIPYTGYNLELFLGDFNGDGRDEIMVRGEYGGSGGYEIAAIYEYRNTHLVEIFNPDMFSIKYKFKAQYLDGYKALVESVTLKEQYIFDISKTPEIYLNMIYYENGKVRDAYEPTISAINGAYPIKIVFEKNYYLFIRQKVIGVSNADTIGYIESFVNLLNNDIKVVQMGAYHFGEKENLTDTSKTFKGNGH